MEGPAAAECKECAIAGAGDDAEADADADADVDVDAVGGITVVRGEVQVDGAPCECVDVSGGVRGGGELGDERESREGAPVVDSCG